jgi:pimeloyl-ACP methyl ester carboxylesterase
MPLPPKPERLLQEIRARLRATVHNPNSVSSLPPRVPGCRRCCEDYLVDDTHRRSVLGLIASCLMALINSNGVPIHYDVFGTGQPIVLVHGFLSSFNDNWQASGWVDFLVGQGRRVIGLDVRGHGASGKSHDASTYEGHQMPDDVIAVINAEGLQRVDLMGYSMGGWIAVNLLSRYPQRFNSVIVGGAGLHPFRQSDAIITALEADDPSTISDPTALGFRNFAQAQSQNDLKALAAVQRAERAPADETALRSVKVAVLVVVGDLDETLERARLLAETVPNAELVLLPGEDHLSAVRAQSHKDAVGAFLKQQALSPA